MSGEDEGVYGDARGCWGAEGVCGSPRPSSDEMRMPDSPVEEQSSKRTPSTPPLISEPMVKPPRQPERTRRTYMHVHKHMHMHMHVHVHVHGQQMHKHVHKHMHMHMHMHVHVHMHGQQMHKHVHKHTHMHMHMHGQERTRRTVTLRVGRPKCCPAQFQPAVCVCVWTCPCGCGCACACARACARVAGRMRHPT